MKNIANFEKIESIQRVEKLTEDEKLDAKHRRSLEAWKVKAPLFLPYFNASLVFLLLLFLMIYLLLAKPDLGNLQSYEKIALAILPVASAVLGYRSGRKNTNQNKDKDKEKED